MPPIVILAAPDLVAHGSVSRYDGVLRRAAVAKTCFVLFGLWQGRRLGHGASGRNVRLGSGSVVALIPGGVHAAICAP
jgi:hypothetical protein